jgi:hypothetical protein
MAPPTQSTSRLCTRKLMLLVHQTPNAATWDCAQETAALTAMVRTSHAALSARPSQLVLIMQWTTPQCAARRAQMCGTPAAAPSHKRPSVLQKA